MRSCAGETQSTQDAFATPEIVASVFGLCHLSRQQRNRVALRLAALSCVSRCRMCTDDVGCTLRLPLPALTNNYRRRTSDNFWDGPSRAPSKKGGTEVNVSQCHSILGGPPSKSSHPPTAPSASVGGTLRSAARRQCISESRGNDLLELCLACLPMGWSWAPAYGQRTSNVLVDDIGKAWVDNAILAAKTKAQLLHNVAQFRDRCARIGADFDLSTLQPSQTIEAIGVECDLKNKQSSFLR